VPKADIDDALLNHFICDAKSDFRRRSSTIAKTFFLSNPWRARTAALRQKRSYRQGRSGIGLARQQRDVL
jgi:hypothetical protein